MHCRRRAKANALKVQQIPEKLKTGEGNVFNKPKEGIEMCFVDQIADVLQYQEKDVESHEAGKKGVGIGIK